MNVLYNEIEPYCCDVLETNIARGWLPEGVVDRQDVRKLTADDLGYQHIHLFAGIGGFPLAAKWAEWPDEWSLITGGPPCQPTSVAGAQRGEADPRYLWPEMDRLVEVRKPRFVIYENPTGTPELAIDRVCSDLEGQEYEVWPPVVLPACAVSAPHRRDRVWIIAHSPEKRPVPGLESLQTRKLPRQYRGIPGRDWVFGLDNPPVCRVDDGLPPELDGHESLGNAIVPQVAAEIMTAIIESQS